MRWFWQRRKKDTSASTVTEDSEEPERRPRMTSPRATVRSIPLAGGAEPRDALLAFARDLLNAQGARVRVEEDDLVVATFASAPAARYTTTVARARTEAGTTLLTPGAPSLDSLFDEAAQRARLTSATLARIADPAVTALASLTIAPHACERCAGANAFMSVRDATCDTCPLRHGGLALRWESRPVSAEVTGWSEANAVELTYRIAGRDRRGRRDEWVRLAFAIPTGARIEPLTLEQLSQAYAAGAGAGQESGAAARGIHLAAAALRPGMEALAGYLAQRVGAEYQQRAEDITSTHERLKRERPNEADAISSALDRELASLADVYGVDVDASLEAICFITSPIATIRVATANSAFLAIEVDAGRDAIIAAACGVCGHPARFGRVCAHGHLVCSECVEVCGRCDALRCPSCDPAPFTRCALCNEITCRECARICDACGETHCADHVWRCVEGDQALCIRDLALCEVCQAPVCSEHARGCSVCAVALCPPHTQACKSGGEVLCAEHAAHCVTCAAPLCATHAQRCEECWRSICREDTLTCLGCGRGLCMCSDLAPCASCGESYCSRCRRENGMVCPACRNLTPAGDDDLGPLRIAASHDPAINLKRTWLMGRNALARVYIGRGLGRDESYIVSEQGDLIASHRKGWRA